MTERSYEASADLILASASPSRRRLLKDAGVDLAKVSPADVDEENIKQALQGEGASADHAAEVLAEFKAKRISMANPGALVIGADQMLALGNRWFDKAKNMQEARENLLELKGKTHSLIASVVVVQDGTRLWGKTQDAKLHMRDFSNDFLDSYLEAMGEKVTQSVGGYELEGMGVQLFSHIEGDFFTILGLPLLPLLKYLRERGALQS